MKLPRLNASSFTRIPLALFSVALLLNISIFMLIQQLVGKKQGLDLQIVDLSSVNFIRIEKKTESPTPKEENKDVEQTSLEKEPPLPSVPDPQIDKPKIMNMEISPPNMDIPLSVSGTPYLGDVFKPTETNFIGTLQSQKVDTHVQPTLRIPPMYPLRALQREIEGIVSVEFTIDVNGSVKDPEIVKANPPEIFNRAVLTAILQWKFDPHIVDGNPVEKRARQDIEFKLQR